MAFLDTHLKNRQDINERSQLSNLTTQDQKPNPCFCPWIEPLKIVELPYFRPLRLQREEGRTKEVRDEFEWSRSFFFRWKPNEIVVT